MESGNGWGGRDGQRRADPWISGGVDWEDGDAFRQDRKLGRKANLKGKIISFLVNMLSLR